MNYQRKYICEDDIDYELYSSWDDQDDKRNYKIKGVDNDSPIAGLNVKVKLVGKFPPITAFN